MGPTYYEATAGQRPARPRLAGIVETEICIIGAGFAGLATAISLIERGITDVVVLEGQRIGHGASGRNGGFAMAGYSLDAATLLAQQGPMKARALFALTRDALETIRDRIAHYRIECGAVDGGALWVNWFDDDALLRRQQALLARHFDVHWRFVPREGVPAFVRSGRYTAGLLDEEAFHFHPIQYALGLAAAIEAGGGRIFEHSPALEIAADGAGHRIRLSGGTVKARQIVVASGATLPGLVAPLSRALLPIATYAMATEPLGDALAAQIPGQAAIYDTRHAFDYYRPLPDTRILWGGRVAIRDRAPADIARFLKADLVKVFPGLRHAKVDFAWGGWMGCSRHAMPHIGQLGGPAGDAATGLWHAQGFGGHGVAPTTAAGTAIADAIAGLRPLPEGFADYGLARAWGPAGLLAAQARIGWAGMKDRLRLR